MTRTPSSGPGMEGCSCSGRALRLVARGGAGVQGGSGRLRPAAPYVFRPPCGILRRSTVEDAMDFGLSADQTALREAAERFAADRLAPGSREREETGRIDRALLREMGGLCLSGPHPPEAHGAHDLTRVPACPTIQALAPGDPHLTPL